MNIKYKHHTLYLTVTSRYVLLWTSSSLVSGAIGVRDHSPPNTAPALGNQPHCYRLLQKRMLLYCLTYLL